MWWCCGCLAYKCNSRACSKQLRLTHYCAHLRGGIAAGLRGRQRQRTAGGTLLLLALRPLRSALLPLTLAWPLLLPMSLLLCLPLLLLRAAGRRHSAVGWALTVAAAPSPPVPHRPEHLHYPDDVVHVYPMQTSARHATEMGSE
jgi:hypothetical protein